MRAAVVVILTLLLAGCASNRSSPSSTPALSANAEQMPTGSMPRPWVTTATYPANASLGTISAWLQSEYARIGRADAEREAASRPRESVGGSLGHCTIDNSPRPDVLPPVEWTRLAKRCHEEMVSGTSEQQFEAICMLRDVRDATIGRPDISGTFPSDYGPAIIKLIASPNAKVRQFAAAFAGSPCFTPDPLDAVPALLTALEDEDAEVRKWAASSLCALSYERLVEGSDILAKGLGEHSQAALEPMLRAIPKAEKVPRFELFTAIGNLGEAGVPAVPVLVRYLSSDDRLTRVGALRALEGLGPLAAEARPQVARLLRENAGGERSQAGRTLMAIEGRKP